MEDKKIRRSPGHYCVGACRRIEPPPSSVSGQNFRMEHGHRDFRARPRDPSSGGLTASSSAFSGLSGTTTTDLAGLPPTQQPNQP
jgi:hypothetical protein